MSVHHFSQDLKSCIDIHVPLKEFSFNRSKCVCPRLWFVTKYMTLPPANEHGKHYNC